MSLKSSRVARFLLCLLLTTTAGSAGFAQPVWNYDRITSCVDSPEDNSITMSTMRGAPIAAPSIHYLPGPNNQAMLVADFAGLSYLGAPHIIHPAQVPGKWGIEEIRIGQFQVNPPICRVAAISRNPASLKGLSFTSNSGTLIVKWAGPKGLLQETEEVAEAQPKSDTRNKTEKDQSTVPAQPNSKSSSAPKSTSKVSLVAEKPKSLAGDTSASVTEKTAQAATQAKSTVVIPPVKMALLPSQRDPLQIDDGEAQIQHIKDLLNAAKRSKVVPGKVPAAAVEATNPKSAPPTTEVTIPKSAPPTTEVTVPKSAPPATEVTVPKLAPAATVPTAQKSAPIAKLDALASPPTLALQPQPVQNNKLLTTPSQDGSASTDTIREPVGVVDPSQTKDAKDTEPAAGEVTDLPSKQKSDTLRTDKKAEKPPGVPMARLSVVSDTESSEPNAAIQLLSERNISYKSFRLHAPERYIIDLEKPADLDEATVALFQENSLCRSVRIGLIDKKTCRLVFDLASDSVQVQEKTFAEDGKVLTLKIFSQAPTVMTKSGRPLEGVSIVLDAGHGGSDPGAQRGDAREKEMTLGIVNQLKKRLEANGAFITMTRSDDTFVSLEDRVKMTNLVMPKAFVSVHINALESTSDIKGVETYYQTEQSKPLADAVHNSLYTSLGVPNRGVRKARFYVINHTSVPAILAEVGYISNKDEREKLISSDYQGKIADAVTQGVILYVNKNPETPASTVKTAPVINFNQSAVKGTTQATSKSVAETLSESDSIEVRTVK